MPKESAAQPALGGTLWRKHTDYRGSPGATRTPDTRFRKPLLCPPELRGHGVASGSVVRTHRPISDGARLMGRARLILRPACVPADRSRRDATLDATSSLRAASGTRQVIDHQEPPPPALPLEPSFRSALSPIGTPPRGYTWHRAGTRGGTLAHCEGHQTPRSLASQPRSRPPEARWRCGSFSSPHGKQSSRTCWSEGRPWGFRPSWPKTRQLIGSPPNG